MRSPSVKIAALALFTFLFFGIGTASLFPILIASLAHAHPVFISEGHHKTLLVLHHPGNHDEHESREDLGHRHDLFDNIVGVSKKTPVSHTDHVVELPSFEEKVSTTAQGFIDVNTLSFLANVHILPFSIEPRLGHHFTHLLPPIDPYGASLRSTLLRI